MYSSMSEGRVESASARELFASLSGRLAPETVLALVLDVFGDTFSFNDKKLISTIAIPRAYRSLMQTEFEPVAPIHRPLSTLCLLTDRLSPSRENAADPAFIRGVIAGTRGQIGMAEGQTDYKHNRLDRRARHARGIDISRRRYDKLFRLIAHIETETTDMVDQIALFELGRFAKIGFAPRISAGHFFDDPATAAFVAYYTANLGRRSTFTNGAQARALDTVAARLLSRCGDGADWYAIAHVFPRADILARLGAAERFALLDLTLATMSETATRLEACIARSNIDVINMTVGRGQDSSTWNTLAGAWNRARDFWIALVWSLGQESFADAFLPGKVMRLIAADVAAWHRASGEGVHPDTLVWNKLPKPWEVVAGAVACTRSDVEAVCAACGVDPAKTGWSAPRARVEIEAWTPTPELVHGVIVDHPALAQFLRRIGVFSGKELRLPTEA